MQPDSMKGRRNGTAAKTEKTVSKTVPGDKPWQFKPGQSGNPNGRPKGARNAVTVALEALLDNEGETLTRKAIELAAAGDMAALRLCMDRVLPVRRDRPVTFALPPIVSAADAAAAMSSVLAAVAAGEITPADAAEVSKLIDSFVKAFEAGELAERLERLERMTAQRGACRTASPS